MSYTTIESIKAIGFSGFNTIEELRNNKSLIPKEKGVYLILNSSGICDFSEVGTGGFFKGKNPNVTLDILKENWIENSLIIYIGKATSLHKRIGQYLSFGNGRNVGHWGGRYIWQIQNSNDLIVCWKATEDDPRRIEMEMIKEFTLHFGKRPFANLVN